jgi:hypothetical protein
MKRTAFVAAAVILAGASVPGEESLFNPARIPPGSIVYLVARRPPVSLSRAEVLELTNKLLTVSHNREKFQIAESNVLELTVLQRPPDPNAPPTETKKSIWQRLLSFWKK